MGQHVCAQRPLFSLFFCIYMLQVSEVLPAFVQESYISIVSPCTVFESKNAEVSLHLNHKFEFVNGFATLCIII